MCAPVLSHNTATNAIVLKITVPKRTGRKRKRGSQGPYVEEDTCTVVTDGSVAPSTIGSQTKKPKMEDSIDILRSLKDNAGNYTVEAVAAVETTHRFRGEYSSNIGVPNY